MFDFSIVTQWVHSLLTSFMHHAGIRSDRYYHDFHGT